MPRSLLVVTAHRPSTEPREAIHHIASALQSSFERVTFATVLDRVPGAGKEESASESGCDGAAQTMQVLTLAQPRVFGTNTTFARWFAGFSPLDAWIEPAWQRLDVEAARADIILVQSGIAAQLLPRLRHRGGSAQIIYLAAEPGDAALTVVGPLTRTPLCVDRVVVLARSMLRRFEDLRIDATYVPVGVDAAAQGVLSGPLELPDRHAVVPASRLFDASVLRIAALSLPDIRFHLFGAEDIHRYPANVTAHGLAAPVAVMSLVRTACLGVAAYRNTADAGDLADASLDLATFDHLGIPSVCPSFATGGRPLRNGYEPGRSASVRDAIRRARLLRPGTQRTPAADWSGAARAVLGLRSPETIRSGSRPPVEARHAG